MTLWKLGPVTACKEPGKAVQCTRLEHLGCSGKPVSKFGSFWFYCAAVPPCCCVGACPTVQHWWLGSLPQEQLGARAELHPLQCSDGVCLLCSSAHCYTHLFYLFFKNLVNQACFTVSSWIELLILAQVLSNAVLNPDMNIFLNFKWQIPQSSWTVNMYTANAVISFLLSVLSLPYWNLTLPTFCPFVAWRIDFASPSLFFLHPWQLRLLCVSLQAPAKPPQWVQLLFVWWACPLLILSTELQLIPSIPAEDYISQFLAAISWYGIYLSKTGCHFWPRRVGVCCRNYMLPMELPDYSQACTCAVVYCCQNVKSCIRATLVQFFYHLLLWLVKFVLNSCRVAYPQPALHLSLAPAQYCWLKTWSGNGEEETPAKSYCCVRVKYSPSRISQELLSSAPSNFNLYYVSLVWEYHIKEYQKPLKSQHMWYLLLLPLWCAALLKGNALIWNDLTNLFWLSFIITLLFKCWKEQNPNLIMCPEKLWKTAVNLIYHFPFPFSKDCSFKSQEIC